MTPRVRLSRMVLIVAILALVAVVARVFHNRPGSDAPESVPPSEPIAASDWGSWQPPAVQPWLRPDPSVDDWVFDLFTPPRVFFRSDEGTFLVESPLPGGREDLPEVRLAALEPVPYRFQLSGQAGGGWFIVEDRLSGQFRVVRPGEAVSSAGHRLERLVNGVAIRDPAFDQPLALHLGEVVFSPLPRATLHWEGGAMVPLAIGESREHAGTEITLLRIDVAAQAADVACRCLRTGRGHVLTLRLRDSAETTVASPRDTSTPAPISALAQD